MDTLNVAVIGAGYMGTLHAGKLAAMPRVKVSAVVDVDDARAETLAARVGARACATLAEAIDVADAAVVAVPTESHAAIVRDCLPRGLHLLVEKPVAGSLDEADEAIALAATHDRVLQVAHIERFNPSFAAVRSRIGRPLFIDTERLAAFRLRGADVDVVLDLMIHDLDLVLALVGDAEVSRVSACGFSVLTGGIDIANAYVEFDNGCVANLSASRVSQAPVRKLRAFQHDLYASADLHAGKVRYVGRGASGVEQSEESFDGSDALMAQDLAFVAAVRGERGVAVTGRDGRRALDLALTVGRLVQERLERIAARAD
jgi:predicted dehydrogenase